MKNSRGYLVRQRFNEILLDLSERYFGDVLPAELGHLSPHIFRHIAATYQIIVHKDPARAAQLLNDKQSTVENYYCNGLVSSRDNCKKFHNAYVPRDIA